MCLTLDTNRIEDFYIQEYESSAPPITHSDSHVSRVRSIDDCSILGVCDGVQSDSVDDLEGDRLSGSAIALSAG